MSSPGHSARLNRIFDAQGRALILPVDESLISGPPSRLRKREEIGRWARDFGFTGVLGFQGSLSDPGIPPHVARILNLTVSTTNSTHTHKRRTSTVAHAVRVGADCVAMQVHFTDPLEGEMLLALGDAVAEAAQYGMPVLAIAYPRKAGGNNEEDENFLDLRRRDQNGYTDLVVHGARACVELGADIVKVPHTGSATSFARIVEACAPAKVVVAGGPYRSELKTRGLIREALEGGAHGISIGRGFTESSDPRALADYVHRLINAN